MKSRINQQKVCSANSVQTSPENRLSSPFLMLLEVLPRTIRTARLHRDHRSLRSHPELDLLHPRQRMHNPLSSLDSPVLPSDHISTELTLHNLSYIVFLSMHHLVVAQSLLHLHLLGNSMACLHLRELPVTTHLRNRRPLGMCSIRIRADHLLQALLMERSCLSRPITHSITQQDLCLK